LRGGDLSSAMVLQRRRNQARPARAGDHSGGKLLTQVAHEELLDRLPVDIVFDHLGRLPVARGLDHPAAAIIALKQPPVTALLMEKLFSWVEDQASLDRILVSNPARLYRGTV
jgi:predicted TIM-barrel fold metal-dependent hydrolase